MKIFRKMKMLHQLYVLGWFFIVIGTGVAVFGVFQFFDVRAFVRNAQTAPGRVVNLESYETRGRRGSGTMYAPVITFMDASGQTHTVRTASGHQSPPSHQVGDEILVLYQPGSPKTARIRSFKTLWLLPGFLTCFGLAFGGIGTAALFAARKNH